MSKHKAVIELHPAALELLKAFSKQYGSEVAKCLADNEDFFRVTKIPTGIPSVDKAWSGGLPQGKIVEIYGPEGSGKTSLALHIISKILSDPANKHKIAIFYDIENAVDYEMAATKYGIDAKRFILVPSTSGAGAERYLDMLLESATNDGVCVVALDSVAALVVQKDLEKSLFEGTMAAKRAALLHQALRVLDARGPESCPVLLLNQLQDKINGMGYGETTTTPGGRGMKHYPSLRAKLTRIQSLKNSKGEETGFIVQLKSAKARYSKPNATALFTIDYLLGIDVVTATAEMALTVGLIKKSGTWYTLSINDQKYQGMAAVVKALRDDPKLYEDLNNNLEAALADTILEDEDASTGEN